MEELSVSVDDEELECYAFFEEFFKQNSLCELARSMGLIVPPKMQEKALQYRIGILVSLFNRSVESKYLNHGFDDEFKWCVKFIASLKLTKYATAVKNAKSLKY